MHACDDGECFSSGDLTLVSSDCKLQTAGNSENQRGSLHDRRSESSTAIEADRPRASEPLPIL